MRTRGAWGIGASSSGIPASCPRAAGGLRDTPARRRRGLRARGAARLHCATLSIGVTRASGTAVTAVR